MPLFGKHILDLSPTPSHMRHSEGSFIRMQDGRIAFVWSRYREGRHDGDTSDLAVIFSADEGESWSAPRTLARCEEWGAVNLMSTSMLTLREGGIALLYLKLTPGLQVRPCLRTTKDLLSFSAERDACAGRSGYFCVANGRLRRLSTGRLIYSGGHNEITEKELAQGDHENADNIVMHNISTVRVYLSDDDGESFYEAAAPVEMPLDVCREIREQGLTESGIEELEDGTLMLYARNASGRQYAAYSKDGGIHWSEPHPSAFTSPTSPMTTLRLSDGRFLAAYNPEPLWPGKPIRTEQGMWTGGRTAYVTRLCDGQMQPLAAPRVLEQDAHAGFGYGAAIETRDGAILLAYCAGTDTLGDQNMLCRGRICKIPLCEL